MPKQSETKTSALEIIQLSDILFCHNTGEDSDRHPYIIHKNRYGAGGKANELDVIRMLDKARDEVLKQAGTKYLINLTN